MMQTLPFPCYNPSFLLYLESSVIFLALPFGHLGVHSLTSRWESFLPVSLVLLWRWQGLCDRGGEWRWGPWAEGWQRVWALHEDPSWAPMWPAGPPCCLCLGTVPLLGECFIPPPSHRSSPHPVSTSPSTPTINLPPPPLVFSLVLLTSLRRWRPPGDTLHGLLLPHVPSPLRLCLLCSRPVLRVNLPGSHPRPALPLPASPLLRLPAPELLRVPRP